MSYSEEQSNAEQIIKKKIRRGQILVDNPLAFRLEYDPRDLFMRKEIDSLFDDAINIVNYQAPGNLLVLGTPGTGKTATLRFVERILNEDNEITAKLLIKYINCRNKTSFEIISELVNNETSNISTISLYKEFFKNMNRNHIVILDEIDQGKDRKEIADMLYTLTRPLEYTKEIKKTLNLILASNNLNWVNQLDAAVRSSLSLKTHMFYPYNQNQIIEILRRRLEEGVSDVNCVNSQVIKYIAQKTIAKHNGDSRYAIRALFYAIMHGEKCGDSKINTKNVDETYNKVEKEIEFMGILKLNDQQFIVLYSCAQNKDGNVPAIYDTYLSVMQSFEMYPMKYTNFHHYIQHLENQNFLRVIKKDKELDVEIVIPKDIIIEEFSNRLQRIELYKKNRT